MKNIFIISITLLLYISPIFSQVEYKATDSTKIITMMNGDVRIGEIISDDGREIAFMTREIGKIFINKANIKSIAPYTGDLVLTEDGELRASSPFTTRYYFTTNALPLKKGDDYAMIHLYGPEVHFSVSDRLSVGIMTTWLVSPFVLALKYSIPTKNPNVNFGLGTLIGTSGYLNTFRGYGGLHWGMVTIGDNTKNLTISAGFSYIQSGSNGNFFNGSNSYKGIATAPVISIAGIASVGKKASFIFDSMIFFGSQERTESNYVYDYVTGIGYYTSSTPKTYQTTIAFFMPGMRFQSSAKNAFQVALAGVLYSRNNGELNAFPIPQCSWFFKF